MINYKLTETEVTEKSQHCVTCGHCYIPTDFLLKLDEAKLYCNQDKSKPLSGDVLGEPFNYYDKEVYDDQEQRWAEWSTAHLVNYNGVCDSFRSPR